MTSTKSLSERLFDLAEWFDGEGWGGRATTVREAADARDAQAAEIALLKEGRTLHDELADHLEHELAAQSALLAQAAAALENAACAGVKGASEALAAIRASAGEEQP